MAPHSSTLAWKIPWTEESGGLQSMGSQRVGHDWATSLSLIGEENGTLLQCSCLENPRDVGAWWAAVYGVAQSRTRLKRLSSSSSSRSDTNPTPSNLPKEIRSLKSIFFPGSFIFCMFLYLYTRITTQFYIYKWPRLLHYTEYKCTQQTINISWINSIQVTNAQIRFVRCAHYNNRSQSKFLSLLCQPRSMLAITFFLLQTKWPLIIS